MAVNPNSLLTRGDLLRTGLLFAVAIAAALWVSFQLLQPIPPRTLVLATGSPSGLYHRYGERYRQALAREGVTLVLRETRGAGDNHDLLLDPKSGVDIAFMQGGVVPHHDKGIVMLASLYYEPLWIFRRDAARFGRLNEFAGRRITVGLPGKRHARVRAAAARGQRHHARQRDLHRRRIPTKRCNCSSRAGRTS